MVSAAARITSRPLATPPVNIKRREFGRFHYHGVACRHCRTDRIERQSDRVIPRHGHPDHPDRAAPSDEPTTLSIDHIFGHDALNQPQACVPQLRGSGQIDV